LKRPAITEFKFRHVGHDQVILHERDIRKDSGEFAILRTRERKNAFLAELSNTIDAMPITVIASAIRKDKRVDRDTHPNNPYEIALGFGLERVGRWREQRSLHSGAAELKY
jgi:hypothetical protein